MTTQAFATVSGRAVAGFTLNTSEGGPWFADVDLEEDAAGLAGAVELVVNGVKLKGSIPPREAGTFGLQRRVRIVAGAGGWGSLLAKKGYHNDAGVKARLVADDAAREAGEKIGTFAPARERLAANYSRTASTASTALQDAAGTALWWVDYDGLTHVGERATAAAPASTYEVLGFNPRTKVAELGVDGLTIGIGAIISERLDAPETIRAFTLTLDKGALRMQAVCGVTRQTNQLEQILRAIVERIMNGWLFGKWRYRVVSMAADGRVNLQAVSKSAGVPDLLTIEQWPGVAGAHATLTNGAIVAVEFLEGRRDLPIVSGYAGKQSDGYVPSVLTLGGESGAAEVARKGDSVKCLYPPTVITGTMIVGGVPTPFTGVNVSTTGQILGVIQGGTPAVKAGVGA